MTTGHHLRIVNVGDILSPAAHRNSAGEAVIDITKGHRITFGDLNERVNRLSHALIATVALTPGDRVAILSKNAAEYFKILFACAKTGLIAQPLNWRLAGPRAEAHRPRSVAACSRLQPGVRRAGRSAALRSPRHRVDRVLVRHGVGL